MAVLDGAGVKTLWGLIKTNLFNQSLTGLSVSGTTLTMTKGNGTTSSVTLPGGVMIQTSAPTVTNVLWIDTGNGGIAKYYNGSAWTPVKAVWG